MSGLQSPQPKSTARSESKIAIEPAGGPHLRVIAADPDVEAAPLEQFNTALAGGDLSRARDALLRFRDEQATERGRLQHEKAQLVQAVEDLQQLLDDRCHAHEEELRQQKDRLVSWNEHEKQALAAEAEKAMSEIQSAQDEFDEHCEQWETERDEQSTLLVEERTRLDHTAAELANRQAEFEVAMAQEQQERLRMADEMISQRESEWAERQKQLEHELKSQRQLHEKQIALDRESFLQACSDREAELNGTRTELDQQRQALVEDRCKTAERFAETRRQLEHDRALVQDGLRQMEAQLRWVSSSISLSGTSAPNGASQSGPLHSTPEAESVATHENTSSVMTDPGTTTSDSFTAVESSTVEASEPQSGWAGVVSPRDESPGEAETQIDAATAAASAAGETEPNESPAPTIPTVESSDENRRARIEDYRSQLATLQASLSHLQSGTTSDSDGSPDGDEDC